MKSTIQKNQFESTSKPVKIYIGFGGSSKYVCVKGQQIFNAAVEGAKRGYNRSTGDYTHYEELLSKVFQQYLNACVNRDERHTIMKKTKGDWRHAYLPICLATEHDNKGGQPCEAHARVYLPPEIGAVFDIPLEDWDFFVKSSALLVA